MPAPLATRRRTLGLMFAAPLATTLAVAGCGGSSSEQARVNLRALNLAADLPSLDLYEGDTRRFAALASDTLGGFETLDAAENTWRVKKAGDGATLLSASLSPGDGEHVTLVLWGRETALRLSVLAEDEDNSDIGSGNARLRVLNATADSGSVDVFLTSSSADLGESASTVAAVAGATASGFRELSSGTYRLRVTGSGDPNDLRLDMATFTLADRQHATLVLTAGASGVLLDGVLIPQQGQAALLKNTQARVRVAAGVDSAGSVGVSLGGRTLAGALRSPSLGPYQLVDAGSQTLVVRINGSELLTTTRSFTAGSDHTLLVYGTAAAGELRVLIDDNRLPGLATRSKLRLVHGAAGVDALTLSVDYLALATDTVLGTASATSTVTSSTTARVDVSSASAAAAVYTAEEVNLQGLAVYSVFVLGGNASPTGLIRKER